MQRGDSIDSIDPVINCLATRLTRIAYFAAWRADLEALARRLAGTKATDSLAEKRGWSCCDWAVRTIAPATFDFWAHVTEDQADVSRARAWAEALRALPKLENDPLARGAARIVQGALADAEAASYAPPIDGSVGKDPMWGLRSPGWQAASAAALVARSACSSCYFTSGAGRADYAATCVEAAASGAYALVADRLIDDWTAANTLFSDASRPLVEPWWHGLWNESIAQLTRLIEMTDSGT